ncbi:MAG: TolB family protein [Planctomycetota bacterium]
MQKLSIGVGAAIAILSGPSKAQTTSLVSRNTLAGTITPDFRASLSTSGRFVAFSSTAANVVPNDTNGVRDVFVHDRQTGSTTLVSRSSSGIPGNGASSAPSISADGRLVAFASDASNLISVDSNGRTDVFLHDRQTGTTSRVSESSTGVPGNNSSTAPAISGDGLFVAFSSSASSFVPEDTTGFPDIYVRNLQTGTTELVSRSSAGVHSNNSSSHPSISFDGRFVAFDSLATNLVTPDGNGIWDVFVRDRMIGTTELMSLSSGGGTGNSRSALPSISSDGRFVAFQSTASDLVPADSPADDVFVRDRLTGTTEKASRDSIGIPGNSHSGGASISADGQHVAFESWASNLIASDTNGTLDVFVHHRSSGATELASRSSAGVQGDDHSVGASISADGRFVAFSSDADNLVPPPPTSQRSLFVYDGAPVFRSFCFGDGSGAPCPCGNSGSPGRGCQNSASTGGAMLAASGAASLAGDTVVLTASGELPSALSIVLQGSLEISAVNYGDGLRCVGGTLKRLYVKNAVGGVVIAPQGADPSVSSRSAALGSLIPAGASRYYQTYHRDPSASFCPDPPGNAWNVTNAIEVVWGY